MSNNKKIRDIKMYCIPNNKDIFLPLIVNQKTYMYFNITNKKVQVVLKSDDAKW